MKDNIVLLPFVSDVMFVTTLNISCTLFLGFLDAADRYRLKLNVMIDIFHISEKFPQFKRKITIQN